MAKNLVNLTPHSLNVFDAAGANLLATIAPTAPAARCATKNEQVGEANGIPLFATTYGEVTDLPEPKEDTIYVVSLIVRQAAPHRADLASPGELIRDENGQPKGCKGLTMNQPAISVKPVELSVYAQCKEDIEQFAQVGQTFNARVVQVVGGTPTPVYLVPGKPWDGRILDVSYYDQDALKEAVS